MRTQISSDLIQDYCAQIKGLDEILDKNGTVKPHWQQLFSNIDAMGLAELGNRGNDILAKLKENGVTYNVYDSSDGSNRPWKLDPIPFLIEQKEWDDISKGLIQRAKLLDAIYKDIYGPRNLIKAGILPPQVVYNNAGFSPACFDVKIPADNQLILSAIDFARGPDNRMWVMDSRTQSPSGMGYAIENRSVISKYVPELTEGLALRRLAPFLNKFQTAISGLSTNKSGQPNVVYLTPGPQTETFYEHTFIASHFGYTLVMGDDLMVRNGAVWLKSISGLEKVDVIVRRVDDEYCDPLELREDSHLGVPGLLQAIRLGNVVVLNSPGVNVLENHALLPFMKGACNYFFKEDLILPNIATWWCGQEKELKFVLENLNRLIIKKASGKEHHRSIFTRILSEKQLSELRAKILANPEQYVAQEESSLRTAPSLVNGRIEPRLSVSRAFLVSDGTEYHIMNGGLTRSSADSKLFVISNQLGGSSKDTWIVSDTPFQSNKRVVINNNKIDFKPAALPSKSAENLYWAGRYCERMLVTTKAINLVINVLQDNITLGGTPQSDHLEILLKALSHSTMYYPGFLEEKMISEPYKGILEIIRDPKLSSSIINTLSAFLRCVTAVNDKWNHDTRTYINAIQSDFSQFDDLNESAPNRIQRMMTKLQSRLFSFYGIFGESFPRDEAYYLFESGKLIERILAQISLTRAVFNTKCSANTEKELIEAVLINHNLLVYYRQMYKSFVNLETTFDLILLDEKLPYSLSYMLGKLAEYIGQLPNNTYPKRISLAAKAILEAQTKIRLADVNTLTVYDEDDHQLYNLDALLASIYTLVSGVTDLLSNQYFLHAVLQHSLKRYPAEDELKSDDI
jgi:uncharacterized circularly permuted ATP-grasp superfamily protein/uncharacterized alpha-E superfamily protein